jgi:uncharacterized membrane protein
MNITSKMNTQKSSSDSNNNNSVNIIAGASILGGTALAGYGIMKRSWSGAAMAVGGACLAYKGLNDITHPYSAQVKVTQTIGATPTEIHAFLQDSRNWKKVLKGIDMESNGAGSVKLTIGSLSNSPVISEAHVTDQQPGKFMAWTSGDGPMQHHGVLHFRSAPGDRGTELSTAFEFNAPAGPVARAILMFLGKDPEQLARESLRRLKQLIEAGEIPTIDNQPSGARGLKGSALRVMYRESSVDKSDETRMAGD